MKRVIITGATSMIGLALIEECIKQNTEVYAVIRENSGKAGRLPDSTLIHRVSCELERLEELSNLLPKGCDAFYHIAWGYTGANRNKSTELQSKNIAYTLEAVKAAKALECGKFIGAGSQAEYGVLDVEKIGPDSPVHPTTPYGASKLAAGQLAFMLGRELGISCIWPRIFSVYGIYEKESAMVASCLRKMMADEETSFTPGEQRWDYLYSKDAGRAFYLMGEWGKDQSVYCIGSGQARPLKEYIREMAQITGTSISPGIGIRAYPPGAVMNLCADIRSLTEDTGFVPEYSFAEGIRETAAWLRRI